MAKLNIIYASEMGTAMDVADRTEAIAKEKGVLMLFNLAWIVFQ